MTLFKLLISGGGVLFQATYNPTFDELAVGIQFPPAYAPLPQAREVFNSESENEDDEGEQGGQYQYP